MIIVAGWLRVAPHDRPAYLEGCAAVIEAARSAAGCLDFHLSADPLDPARINVFERWDDAASVERFRGDGIGDDQQAVIVDASVAQYEVTGSTSLT